MATAPPAPGAVRGAEMAGPPQTAGKGLASVGPVLPYSTEKLLEHYDLRDDVIGRGQFGIIRVCEQRTTRKLFACKTVMKSSLVTEEHVSSLRSEISILEEVRGHPHIVELQAVFEDEEKVDIVMELCSGGDLFGLLLKNKRLSEQQAAWMLRKMLKAVTFCHKKGIVHRDIKPENILLQVRSDGVVEPKLADFGLAVRLAPGKKATGFAGSPFYMCPEGVLGKEYGSSCDIWSLGVLLFIMVSGNLPFREKTLVLTLAAVCRGKPDYEKHPWPLISVPAKKAVFRMLSLEARHRPTGDDLLTNSWVKGAPSPASSLSSSSSTSASHVARPTSSSPPAARREHQQQLPSRGTDRESLHGPTVVKLRA